MVAWLRRKVRSIHTAVLLWMFFGFGRRLFDYTYIHHNRHGRCTAMLFAQDARELNIAVRSYIEWLDSTKENNETRQR